MALVSQDDFIREPHLGKPHVDSLGVGGRHVLADEIGLDGEFAMSTVDQHGQLNAPRAAEIVQRVHRRARRPPAIQHIVHQHDRLAGHVERDDRGLDIRGGSLAEIVPVHAHIQQTYRHGLAPYAGEQGAESVGQGDAASLDAH